MSKIAQNSNKASSVLGLQNDQSPKTKNHLEVQSSIKKNHMGEWKAKMIIRKSHSHHKIDEQMRLFLLNDRHAHFKTTALLLKLATAHKKQSSKKHVCAHRDLKVSELFAIAYIGFSLGTINPNSAHKDTFSFLASVCNTLQGLAQQRNRAHEIETQHEHENLQYSERKLDEEAQRNHSQKDDLLRQIQQAEEKERSTKQSMIGR